MNNLTKSAIILTNNIFYGVTKFTRESFKERLREEDLKYSDTTINRILNYLKEELGITIRFKRNGFAEIVGEPDPSGPEQIEVLKSFYLRSTLLKSTLDSQLFNQVISYGLDVTNFNIELVQPLLDAIMLNNVIHFDYQSFIEEEKKSYVANPIFLKEYLNRWYVIAETDKTPHRVFALDRISNFRVSRKTFTPNLEVKTKLYENTIGVNFSGEVQIVVLWVHPEQYKYFKTLPIHKS